MGRDQNLTFSEYGHVAYQIKGNDACSNMVANNLPVDTPSLWGVIKAFFLKVVMLHIKLKKLEQRAPRKLSLHTSSAPGVGTKGQNMFF